MDRINAYNGYTGFVLNGLERYKLKYLPICQHCGFELKEEDVSILIPHYPVNMCETCFNRWTVEASYREIDMNHEENAILCFLQYAVENGVG